MTAFPLSSQQQIIKWLPTPFYTHGTDRIHLTPPIPITDFLFGIAQGWTRSWLPRRSRMGLPRCVCVCVCVRGGRGGGGWLLCCASGAFGQANTEVRLLHRVGDTRAYCSAPAHPNFRRPTQGLELLERQMYSTLEQTWLRRQATQSQWIVTPTSLLPTGTVAVPLVSAGLGLGVALPRGLSRLERRPLGPLPCVCAKTQPPLWSCTCPSAGPLVSPDSV